MLQNFAGAREVQIYGTDQNGVNNKMNDENQINNDVRADLQEYLLQHRDDLVTHILEYNELMNRYQAAIREVTTKLEILKSDFTFRYHRKTIESIQSRLKKPASIVQKMRRKGVEVSLDNIRKTLYDIAGIRVICPFLDDIYLVANALAQQDDITVVAIKDFIQNPKPNGYRSYHMIVDVPVFFADTKEALRVEVQLRTVAMDFWASLEHEIKYKKDLPDSEQIAEELRECADVIAQTDQRMLQIRNHIYRDAPEESFDFSNQT